MVVCSVASSLSLLLNGHVLHAFQVQSNYTIDIKCKPEYHRFLIGRGGANIRRVGFIVTYCLCFSQCSLSTLATDVFVVM